MNPERTGLLEDLARSEAYYCEDRVGVEAVLAVGGLIGAGKSTLAHALGPSLGVAVVDSDRTRKETPPTTRV